METNKGQETYYPFDDNFRIFLFKKVERLSLAVYLITSHLSNRDSLKTNLRSIADTLIKDIINFNDSYSDINNNKKLKEDFLELQSLLSIGLNINLINKANIEVLLDEIFKLSKDIENHKDILVGGADIKKSFFVVENSYKGHKGQESEEKVLIPTATKPERRKGQKDAISQGSRTEEIMKIIKDNEKVTIKDISANIKDISEKTIQRELLKMVSLNLIKKEGERRWSTYSIK